MKDKIKILYINPFAFIGGGELGLLTIIRSLDPKGFESLVVCYGYGSFVDLLVKNNIEVKVIERTGLISNFVIVWKLFRIICKRRISLIHINSLDIRAVAAGLLAGIPCITHLRVIIPFTWRDRLAVYLSEVTIGVSRAVIEALTHGGKRLERKFILIPCTIDIPEHVEPVLVRQEFEIPSDALLVGVVARIDPVKGIDDFLHASFRIKSRIPKARFLVIGCVGDNDEAGRRYEVSLRALVAKYHLERDIIFTGFRNDALGIIASLDVIVIPSAIIQSEYGGNIEEGFSRVAVEALAVGVPVVATSSGGLKEIIINGTTGICVQPGNPEKIADAVESLIVNKDKRDYFVMQGKNKYLNQYKDLVKHTHELYYLLAKGGKLNNISNISLIAISEGNNFNKNNDRIEKSAVSQ